MKRLRDAAEANTAGWRLLGMVFVALNMFFVGRSTVQGEWGFAAFNFACAAFGAHATYSRNREEDQERDMDARIARLAEAAR